MRIAESARKHGVFDHDMLHAYRSAIRRISFEEGYAMYIGPARNGSHLEVGVIAEASDDPIVIHAMPLRSAFYRYL